MNFNYLNLNREYHAIGRPARISEKGVEWYLNGELHRENGPAIERPNGNHEWYYKGMRIKNKYLIIT